MEDFSPWIERSKRKIATLSPGTEFAVRDVFETVDWEKMSRGDRRIHAKTARS